MEMETMIRLAHDLVIFWATNGIDLILGIGLCFLARWLKPKVAAGVIGIYTGAQIGLFFGLLIVDGLAFGILGAVGGALFFASVNWGISGGEKLILGFVAGGRVLFTVISGIIYMGHGDFLLYAADLNLAASVMAGILFAIILYLKKEIHPVVYRCLYSLIGVGWILGGMYFMLKSMEYIENDLMKFSEPVDFLLPLMKLEFDEDAGLASIVLGAMLFLSLFHLLRIRKYEKNPE